MKDFAAALASRRRALAILAVALAAWIVDMRTGATALGIFAWLSPALLSIAWMSPAQRRTARADVLRLAVLVPVLAIALALPMFLIGMRPVWWTCLRTAALDIAALAPLVLLTRALTAAVDRRFAAASRGRAIASGAAQLVPAVIGLPIVLLAVQVHRAQGTASEGESAIPRPAERVAITGAGGTRLAGLWFENPAARGAVLLVHGIGAEKTQFLPAVSALYQRGYHVLTYDQRNHGESGGATCTLGAAEGEDLARAWELLRDRTRGAAIPRVIYGISMGGAAAQSALPHLEGVDGLILDSTFADVQVIARRRLPIGPLAAPLVRAVRPLGVLLTGRDVLGFDASAIAARAPASLPVLILHAREDPVVPFSEAEALVRIYGPRATLVAFDGAHHAGGFVFDGRRHQAAVEAFAAKVEGR
ncbi:MAG: alpha/beta fold hydrolase [Minicystis sp.]